MEEYQGKDIVFMSLSTDKEEDHQTWKKMVTEEALKGVQLFAGKAKADIYKAYDITGIPRFILVGKDGKLLNVNAPRPSSDKEIRSMLNAALAK